MSTGIVLPILVLMVLSSAPRGAAPACVVTHTEQTSQGFTSQTVPATGTHHPTAAGEPQAIPGGRREGTILWHRHQPTTIYSSCGISQPADLAFAGTLWNTIPHVEAVSLGGDGTPTGS